MPLGEGDGNRNDTASTGRRRGPRKRGARASGNGTPHDAAGSDAVDTGDEDHPELFEILGVTPSEPAPKPAPKKGLLRLNKELMDIAQGPKAVSAPASGREDTGSEAERPVTRSQRTQQTSPPANNKKTQKKKRGGAKAVEVATPDQSFDVSSLSKSLPTEGFFATANGKTSDGQGWDMPVDAPNAPQPLNWQQQLGADDTPSKRSTRSSTAARRNKAKPERPTHDRRKSLDHVPGVPTPTGSPAPPRNHSASAFDNSPFHTGFNVHRAPQTPVRTAANSRASPVPTGPPGVITLPIVGQFPRINKATGVPMGGPKYAGPTFHNSPHSASLPKPDLDDF
ncbi:hypothetical protein Q8F55_005105 [Vanrija albida]|uniref:Uncharacterized protein n=1 Tax=Vanrija albida TaxID=181172 RepID=A0ABR3Q0R5_9TREE